MLSPNDIKAWYNKGNALNGQGKYDEAIKAFDETIRLDPNLATVWNNKGIALGRQGKYDEAVKAFDEAIRIDPNRVVARYNKGNPEVEKEGKITFIIVIDNQRFPVNDFHIDKERKGYVVVRDRLTSVALEVAFSNDKKKKHYCSFNVWDYSRKGRIVWNLRLVKKEEHDDYTLFYFEYNYTHLELIVAEVLDRIGAKFLPQVPIDNYLVDFYIEPDIIIEVDGPHHECIDQREKDQYKDKILRSYDFKVERISYYMVENLSLDLVSGELPTINLKEEKCLEDLNTRINIILSKKGIDDKTLNHMDDLYYNKLT
jgi:very-short-patch-repair endonuclease